MYIAPHNVERAKKLAKTLKSITEEQLKGPGTQIPFSQCLEVIAAGCSLESWHVLSARLKQNAQLSWSPEKAASYLAHYLSLAHSEAMAIIASLSLRMKPKTISTTSDIEALMADPFVVQLGLERWQGQVGKLVLLPGFAGILAAIQTSVAENTEAFVTRNVSDLFGPRGALDNADVAVKNELTSYLTDLAKRPRHPAWPVLTFLMIYYFAMNSSRKEKLMEENVWTEVMLAFIPVVHAFDSGDPIGLASTLWRLETGMRANLAEMGYSRVALMLGNFIGGRKGSQIPKFLEMTDIPVAAQMSSEDVMPIADTNILQVNNDRWSGFGLGDLQNYIWIEEEEGPRNFWSIGVTTVDKAERLLPDFPAVLEIDLGPAPDRIGAIYVVGLGPNEENVHPAAAIGICKRLTSSNHLIVDIQGTWVQDGLDPKLWEKLLCTAVLFDIEHDLARMRYQMVTDDDDAVFEVKATVKANIRLQQVADAMSHGFKTMAETLELQNYDLKVI